MGYFRFLAYYSQIIQKKRKIKTNALLEVDTHLRDLIKLFNEPYSSKDTTAAAGEMCTEKLQLPYWETF